MAPDGRCKFGDAAADGYVRSDGAAMVVLKRLSSALADGDPHLRRDPRQRGHQRRAQQRLPRHARSGGPGGDAAAGLRRRRRRSRAPCSTSRPTAPGTAAGDPVELGALGAVVGAGRPAGRAVPGRLAEDERRAHRRRRRRRRADQGGPRPRSTARSRRRSTSPTPNPTIPWAELGLEVCATRRPWPADDGPRRGRRQLLRHRRHERPRRAGGAPGARRSDVPAPERRTACCRCRPASPAALRALAGVVPRALLGPAGGRRGCDVRRRRRAAGRTTTIGCRRRRRCRAGRRVAGRRGRRALAGRRHRLAPAPCLGSCSCSPGRARSGCGMARELLADGARLPRRAGARATPPSAPRPAGRCSTSWPHDGAGSRLDEIDVVQPRAVRRPGGARRAVAGVGHRARRRRRPQHGRGRRGPRGRRARPGRRRRRHLPAQPPLRRVAGPGRDGASSSSTSRRPTAALAGYEDRSSIAVSNSPRSTVLSGDPDALDDVLADLKAREVFCRRVKVDVASHSPQVDPLLDELRDGARRPGPAAGAGADVLDRRRRRRRRVVARRRLLGPQPAPARPVRRRRRQLVAAERPDRLRRAEPASRAAAGRRARCCATAATRGWALASTRRGEPERPTMLAGLGVALRRRRAPSTGRRSSGGAANGRAPAELSVAARALLVRAAGRAPPPAATRCSATPCTQPRCQAPSTGRPRSTRPSSTSFATTSCSGRRSCRPPASPTSPWPPPPRPVPARTRWAGS